MLKLLIMLSGHQNITGVSFNLFKGFEIMKGNDCKYSWRSFFNQQLIVCFFVIFQKHGLESF